MVESQDRETVRALLESVRAAGRSALTAPEGKIVADAYGIAVPGEELAQDVDEAVAFADRLGGPVVLKIVSPDVLHKTDAGGVVVGVEGGAQVRAAFHRIIENVRAYAPDARIDGVQVQQLVPPGQEVIVGAVSDPTFGKVVAFGLGGVLVEVLADITFRLAPVSADEALSMLDSIGAAEILCGVRGAAPVDRWALAEQIRRVSQLVTDFPEIAEVDLNPVIAAPATEEPGPVERADATTPVGPPNWLLQSTHSDGLVRLHNHGIEDVRYDPYYTRLAYSTVTRPSSSESSYDNSVIVGDDPSRTDIAPLGAGDGWAASRHTVGEGVRVTSVVLAHGAGEVRAHLVTGAAPGTPVRVTGWAARAGVRAELLPVLGLTDSLTGVTGDGDTLFVALARLTGEPDPVPLAETVTVHSAGAGELRVRWSGGPGARIRLDGSGADVVPEVPEP
ncbi:acetate--CoA ligase family protein [Streptomyces sp. NPDC002205]|uniref:acetate--CoA ligase family protein n=1 Tax=Streptomyces sp. NPDC002205 TaxID=3154411 RepID=UPI003333A8E3